MNKEAKAAGKAFESHAGRVMEHFRNLRNYTQDSVGIDLGISGRTVGKYEKAKIPVQASTMAEVSHICDFDMIEYILFEDVSVAEKFKEIVANSGVNPFRPLASAASPVIRTLDQIQDFQLIDQNDRKPIRNHNTKDVLYDYPNIRPFPLCKADDEKFEKYITSKENRIRYKLILYGYGLLRLYDQADVSRQTKSALARQLLRQIIKHPIEGIDQDVYDYYWKCLFDLR